MLVPDLVQDARRSDDRAELDLGRATLMRLEISYRDWDKAIGARHAYFQISHGGNYYRAVKVVIPDMLVLIAGNVLKLEDPWKSPDDPRFQRGVFRYATRAIEDALTADLIEAATDSEYYEVKLDTETDSVKALLALATGDKTCSYQETEGRDLFCTAAAPDDETALPIVLSNGRRIAPTSRPLCAGCSLPDTDYLCSHFLHPQVFGTRAMGGPSGFVTRSVHDGMCDLDRPEFVNHAECHAGGNPCWERIVELAASPAVEPVPPQAIEQALDDLDVRWRLAFKHHVVRLPGAEDVSVLPLPCGSRDEFERRLSIVADILKRLDIPDDVLPDGTPLPDKSHTLDRLELLFQDRLEEDDQVRVTSAVQTLRKVNQLRAGAQHSGAAELKRAQAADALGVRLDGRWGEAWDRVRGLLAQALREVGQAAQKVADKQAESESSPG